MKKSVYLFILLAVMAMPKPALAFEPFIGQIMWFGGNFCPRNWAEADGQLLSISTNSALFSLYGTMYGGDGRTTFGLPDLRGRVAIHEGQGPGLSNYVQGSKGGQETVTLNQTQIPAHTHGAGTLSGNVVASNVAGDSEQPAGRMAADGQRAAIYGAVPAPANQVAMASGTVDVNSGDTTSAGGSQPHENRPPYLTIRACVALTGVYPSRT